MGRAHVGLNTSGMSSAVPCPQHKVWSRDVGTQSPGLCVCRRWMSGLIPWAELLHKSRITCRLPGKTVNNVCARIPSPEPVGPWSRVQGKPRLGS